MTPVEFEPLGMTELGQRWGVSRQRVRQLLDEDPDMPRPKVLRGETGRASTLVWNLEDIEAYEASRPGRRKDPQDSTERTAEDPQT